MLCDASLPGLSHVLCTSTYKKNVSPHHKALHSLGLDQFPDLGIEGKMLPTCHQLGMLFPLNLSHSLTYREVVRCFLGDCSPSIYKSHPGMRQLFVLPTNWVLKVLTPDRNGIRQKMTEFGVHAASCHTPLPNTSQKIQHIHRTKLKHRRLV